MQFLYMFVTYNFTTTVCYTAINLPYGSLSAMMTRESKERDMLSIVRMGLSPFGRILAVTCTLPLVSLFGDNQAAWIKVMSIWAVLAIVLLLVCFFNCEETVRIEAAKGKEKTPVLRSLKALVTNQYFWAVLALWTMQNIIFTLTGAILPYYCKYVMGDSTWMYSTMYMAETLVLVAATFCSPALLRKFGKRNMSLAGAVLALIGHLLFLVNPQSAPWLFFSCIIRAIGLAPLNSIIFGLLGDVIEFGQRKTHLRRESLIFAGGSVGAKVSGGIASAAPTWLLELGGYVSTTQGSANGQTCAGNAS